MSNNKNNFLVQGSILAMAGILTRVIGILYRIPLNNILGEGISAYTIAYDIYSLFLLISSLSLPLAVSKIVAARMAKGEVRNAKKAFKGSMTIAVIIGLAVSILVFSFADELAGLWKFPSAALALKVLAPMLFVMCILGVFRGFFQGLGTMMPTAVSQILEQIINAIVSIAGAYVLYNVGGKVGKSVEYSAAGGTLGTLFGAIFALLFMLFVFSLYRRNFNRMLKRDKTLHRESYAELRKVLLITIFPVLLSTTIYNIGSIIDSAMYGNIMSGVFGFTESQYREYWSIYAGHYRLLTTAPIAIASALSSAVVPSLIRSITNRDYVMLKGKIESSVRLTMIIAIPCGVGLSVLADPIIRILFRVGNLHGDDVLLMRLGVLVVCTYSFSTITNSILQGIDKMRLPVIHSAIALGIHVAVLAILLLCKTDVYGVAIADILFAFIVCIMNVIAIKRHTGYRQEVLKTFILPVLAAAVMGASAWIIYTGLNILLKNVAVPFVVAVLFAILIYGILLMQFKVLDEEELQMFPGGRKLAIILKKVGLLPM